MRWAGLRGFETSIYAFATLALVACAGPNADRAASDGGTVADTGGDSSDGFAPGGPTGSSLVGKQCTEDVDCTAGLSCVRSDSNAFGGGGPPGGLCTSPCTTDRDCGAFDSNSICVGFGSPVAAHYCLERCDEAASSRTRCQRRRDMVCAALVDHLGMPSVAACQPMCGGDFDCNGRKCDFRTGMCVDAPSGTLPTGSVCAATAMTDPCNGFCLNPYGETDAAAARFGSCFGVCALNVDGVGCGVEPTAQPPFDVQCLGPQTAAPGDLGLCYQLCDCNGDCSNEAFICRPWTDQGAADGTGRKGYCRGPVDDAGQAVPDLKCTSTNRDSGTPPPRVDAGAPPDAAGD